ncbi:MAG: hypothetical protein M3Y54_08860, partial [Bacteroidota bacterium]|nr:hypothetical protein [Bacteroidota bacterium]
MRLFLLAGVLMGLAGPLIAQPLAPASDPSTTASTANVAPLPPELKPHGSLYFSWGYNRDWYTRSDIRFKNTTTDNYDFTFHNAHASDKPDFKDFWRFNSLTIPQYDMTLGYLFH